MTYTEEDAAKDTGVSKKEAEDTWKDAREDSEASNNQTDKNSK